jgi:hypothetical protein
MQKMMTSFMALHDPELLAAATSAVGAEAFLPHLEKPTNPHNDRTPPTIRDPYQQFNQQRQDPQDEWLQEDEDEAKLMQQERELAQLEKEVETTRCLIPEVRREVEEATNMMRRLRQPAPQSSHNK